MFSTPKEIFDALLDDGIEITENSVMITRVLNSRVAPKNGIINKSRTLDLPMTYIGGTGTITFSAGENFEKCFHEKNVHLLVGGQISAKDKHGRCAYRYNIAFFIDDYPEIKKNYDEILIMASLNGNGDVYVGMSELNKIHTV